MNSPPVLASLLLHAVAPPAFAHCVEGDLQEEFSSIQIVERGHLGARWWYWRQVLRSIQPLLASGLRSSNWQISALIILLATAGATQVINNIKVSESAREKAAENLNKPSGSASDGPRRVQVKTN